MTRLQNHGFNLFVLVTNLKMCVFSRLLQISSFNGKMNALNEVNKVITSVSYYTHRHSQIDDDEWLTAEKMAVCYPA